MKWEYMILESNHHPTAEWKLNALGVLGWEVIAVTCEAIAINGYGTYHTVLKRALS